MSVNTRPVITLTTDFGTADHFSGVMKGVILGLCPHASIVDITHAIEPYDILQGAYAIAAAYRYFPPQTVHVVVVDPGVGSARRPLLVEAGQHRFVGPDNGVFSMVLAREPGAVIRQLEQPRYWLPSPSHTFHGRDIFAPVAAHCARGTSPYLFGNKIADALRLHLPVPQRLGNRQWAGAVLSIDRFGNLITNFRPDELPELLTRRWHAQVGMEYLDRLVQSYSEAEPGELVAVVGSGGYLEFVLPQHSAARRLGVAAGSPIELEFAKV